jgi:hypothetical protein
MSAVPLRCSPGFCRVEPAKWRTGGEKERQFPAWWSDEGRHERIALNERSSSQLPGFSFGKKRPQRGLGGWCWGRHSNGDSLVACVNAPCAYTGHVKFIALQEQL